MYVHYKITIHTYTTQQKYPQNVHSHVHAHTQARSHKPLWHTHKRIIKAQRANTHSRAAYNLLPVLPGCLCPSSSILMGCILKGLTGVSERNFSAAFDLSPLMENTASTGPVLFGLVMLFSQRSRAFSLSPLMESCERSWATCGKRRVYDMFSWIGSFMICSNLYVYTDNVPGFLRAHLWRPKINNILCGSLLSRASDSCR